MKLRAIFLYILLIPITFGCQNQDLQDGDYSIEIYATNDLHGRFFDSLYTDNQGSKTHPYSLASVSGYIKEARMRSGEENVILLDLGDHLQGDNAVFFYNFIDTLDTHLFAKVANYIGYDAVVVGNHDIEAGKRVYNKIKKEMNAPYLAANAINISTGRPYFQPYTIIRKGGLKIAVLGMTNPNIPKWLSPELWKGIEFSEIFPLIEELVSNIHKKESPHLMIVALHAGLGDYDEYSIENPARFIAKNIQGVDVVFAAHDHKTAAEVVFNGKDSVWVLEGGSRASSLALAKVKIRVKNREIIQRNVVGSVISMSQVEPDSLYLSAFREEFLKVKEFTNRIAGSLNNRITSRDAYFGPSGYVDMIHSLQLERSGAEISFAAPLSFDVTIESGDLNYQDLLNIYPYENQLYVMEMSGEEVKRYLEYSYSKWINKMNSPQDRLLQLKERVAGERGKFANVFFNFDSAAGIIYEVNATKGDGERITILSMADGSPFDEKRVYRVALSSYRASGGGDLILLGAGISRENVDKRVIERLSDIRELLYQYLIDNGSVTAKRLNHWSIIPQEFVKEAAKRDSLALFQ
jgi:2',3'-cyclic-nucleotide 2'-phosphodiesterase/3'-nucleotidase